MSAVERVRLVSCVGVEGELALLPHFVDHYLALGVRPERVHVLLNARDAGSPALEAAAALLAARGVTGAVPWIAPYTSDSMWARRRELQAEVADARDWIVSADVDELHEYPDTLARVLAHCERVGANAVQGVFVDRLAEGGTLAEVRAEPALAEQFPLRADAIGALGGSGRHHDRYGTVKLVAMRGAVLPSRGGHHPLGGQSGVRLLQGAPLGALPDAADPEGRFGWPFRVHHYKWTATLVPGLRRRLGTPGASEAGREYGAKLLAHVEAHGAISLAGIPLDPLPVDERRRRAARGWRARMARARLAHAAAHRWSRLRARFRPSAGTA